MQGEKFKFYIKNKEGYHYFIDELNTVQLSIEKKHLIYSPDGWQEMVAGYYRNEKYKSNFTKVGTPLKFVLDGKKIIDYLSLYEGMQAYANFVIEVQVPDDFSYTLLFDGTIHFKEYRYGEDYSTANIKDNALLDIIEAKEDVIYEIPLTDDNSVNLQHDGINITYKTLFLVDEAYSDANYYNTNSHIIALNEISNENIYLKPTKRVKYSGGVSGAEILATGQPFYEPEISATVDIEFDFKFISRWGNDGATVPGPAASINIRICKIDKDNNFFPGVIIYQRSGQSNTYGVSYLTGKEHHVIGNLSLNALVGEKYYLAHSCFNNLNGELAITEYNIGQPSDFIVKAFQRSKSTIHKAIKPHKVWQLLVNNMTTGKYSGISSYLFSNNNLLLIPGSSLRKDEIVSLKTTVKEFLQFCYVNMLGVLGDFSGKNGEIIHIKDTFLDEESMDIGIVSDLEVYHSTEHAVGTIKVGYPNIDIGVDNQINGKEEFNQTSDFTTGQDEIKSEYNIVSSYNGSIFEIEKLRTIFLNKKTTDNKSDNKVFIIDSEQGTDINWHIGIFDAIAPNQIKVPGILSTLINGTILKITGAAANNGNFTVINTSYLIVGFTTITLSGAIVSATALSGSITYYDSNVYKPSRPLYASITGILDPLSVYNTRISAKNLLLLHDKIIAGGVYNVLANTALDVIKFESSDKNSKLSVSYDNIKFITENSNELVSSLSQPYYLNIYFSFKTDYRPDLFTFLSGKNKFKYISFEWKGNKYAGYLIDVTANIDGLEEQNWKLLSTATTNIINLI